MGIRDIDTGCSFCGGRAWGPGCPNSTIDGRGSFQRIHVHRNSTKCIYCGGSAVGIGCSISPTGMHERGAGTDTKLSRPTQTLDESQEIITTPFGGGDGYIEPWHKDRGLPASVPSSKKELTKEGYDAMLKAEWEFEKTHPYVPPVYTEIEPPDKTWDNMVCILVGLGVMYFAYRVIDLIIALIKNY